LSTGTIAVVVVVVLVVLGLIGWRLLGPSAGRGGGPNPYEAANAPKMQPGQPPGGQPTYMGGGAPAGSPYGGGPGGAAPGPPGGSPYGGAPGGAAPGPPGGSPYGGPATQPQGASGQ